MMMLRCLSAALCGLLFVGCSSKDAPSAGGSATGSTAGSPAAPNVEAQPDTAEWQSFSNAEGRYSILMPGSAQQLPSAGDGSVSHGVELETKGGYIVMYSDIDAVKPEEIEQRLTNVRNDVIGDQKKVLHDETLTVQGHPARDFAYVDADGDAQFYRILIAGNRLYQVMVVTEQSQFESTKADREKFLNSFKIAE